MKYFTWVVQLLALFGVLSSCPSTEWTQYESRCFLFRVEKKHHKSWQDALKVDYYNNPTLDNPLQNLELIQYYKPHHKHYEDIIERTCKSESNGQGSLVSIHNEAENSFIYSNAKDQMGDDEVQAWIGMSKVTSGYPLLWEDLSRVQYMNWDENEPNDFDGTQNCVRMWAHNGAWDDFDCNAPGEQKHGYICQDFPGPEGSEVGGLTPPPTRGGCCSAGDVFAIIFGILIAVEIVAGVLGYLYVFKWNKQFPWQNISPSGGMTSFDNPAAAET